MKEYIFENKIREKYKNLTDMLIQKKITVATMESCTSGQIASLITDTEGSSAVFKGAFVTYSNEAKVMLGVPGDVIDNFGVYSKETAEAMAKVCRNKYKTNIGIGITGTFGNPDPNNPDSIAGQVYFAIDINGQINVYERKLTPQATRFEYKLVIAKEIVEELNSLID